MASYIWSLLLDEELLDQKAYLHKNTGVRHEHSIELERTN